VDVSGITSQVATTAAKVTVVTTIDNLLNQYGGGPGLIFWNPATNLFKWWRTGSGVNSGGIDLNVSAPVLVGPDGGVFGSPIFQPGDVWVTGQNLPYVNFKGSDKFRIFGVGSGCIDGVLVSEASGHVYFVDPCFSTIVRLNPATNEMTEWTIPGGNFRYMADAGSGMLYSIAPNGDEILRFDPALGVHNVTVWPITGGGLNSNGPYTTGDGLAVDRAGNVWFAETDSNEIGRLNPTTGEMCEFTKNGLLSPQLVATSGSGGLLQTFFTEGAGNALGIVTQAEAVPITSPCPVVQPFFFTSNPPITSIAPFSDTFRETFTGTIVPLVVDVPGVDGTPSGSTKTADGIPIPGVLRFPMPTPAGGDPAQPNFPVGLTRVGVANTVFGSYYETNPIAGGTSVGYNSAVFALNSGAIIAPSDTIGPITSNVVAAPNPVAVDAAITLTANVNDSTTGGSNIASAEYKIDAGPFLPMDALDSVFDSVSENVTKGIGSISSTGVHTVCIQGKDAIGNIGTAECILLPVYDPTGGFVTGGGQVASPAGADLLNTSAAGQATFGFVSKYLPGSNTPSGNLEFQFKEGNLNFKSTSMDWLVVTGEPRAKFRGTGTVNGANVCKFEVDAWDGSFSGSVDAFGLKIFSCASGGDRYSLPATALTKGSVIIHK
jgi:hypothetical protein